MLNTDMELIYDIPVDKWVGTDTCSIVATDTLPACPKADTESVVKAFANVSSIISWNMP